MKRLFILFTVLMLSACQGGQTDDGLQGLSYEEDRSNFPQKNVVMIIVDTMMGSLVESSLEKNNMPALRYLVERGQYYNDLVSPFPTMSVTIESTLLTGEMSDKHKVPGLYWYNEAEDRMVNYGTSIQTLLSLGLRDSLIDAAYNLNNKHLNPNVPTIFEELSERGFSTGAINLIVYRGDETHVLEFPGLSNEIVNLPDTIETKGPDLLAFGRFKIPEFLDDYNFTDGIFNRYGINDKYSTEVMRALIEQGDQPHFTLVFFPEFDITAHEHSPHYRAGFEEIDNYLQEILNAYDSWEAALENNIFILLGDHGQDKLAENEEALTIDLRDLYDGYLASSLGAPVSEGEIAFGVNGRMSYIYDVQRQGILQELGKQAIDDYRIDFAAWLTDNGDDDWVTVQAYREKNSEFLFKPGGSWTDRYGQTWSIEGDPTVLTLKLDDASKEIAYVDYPDVLNQLYTSLKSHEASKLILTAKPGFSFYDDTVPTYPAGGDHGGIHKNDALAVLIIAGTDKKPKNLRILDLKDYVLELLSE
ncbi:putative AlkP superfamily pyrophosphatase or phosphodiesterase [Evansella vedderi]|uniref:AlkP superfamily pyrophosphatase or phosphodiesterase n=1 Tax=Evansella vedderi TaxID=38282 RepID=A0ABT9ZQI4_9BACI|nr:alkaline phosphatase family protein [Evansella vedderi]MDQ0253459.1 putative AlkP superfamily pyrophosphatase or phosphodiesterase [Evansella vedderi]